MHSLEEIKKGLDDLKRSAETDIKPIINLDSPEGGYFGVTRAVLSYMDFLGALYCGYKGGVDRNSGRRIISTTKNATIFIKEILGQIYEPYSLYGELMYEMYRHGTVHLYRPHTLINPKGEILEWLTYKGGSERKCFIKYEHKVIFIHHMQPQRYAYERHIFPVSINLLYDDLISAIDLYLQKIRTNEILAKNYSEVVDVLLLPEKSNWSVF